MAESCGSYTREEGTTKWADLIKNSEQIAAEPMKKYLLSTIKKNLNEDGLVRRHTFGRKDPNKMNRTILMVGETSTGKSTLINMMVNYMLGVKWEDNIRFEIIPDEGKSSQTESQTAAITVYEIFGLEELSVPFSLTVIDTPGFGGTGGPGKDKTTAQNLCRLLESSTAVHQIDAACLVVKASEYRLSLSQKYIFDAILSLFGKNMEKNIMTLITFSDWMPPSALRVVSESGVPFTKDENDDPVYFPFNNPPLKKFDKRYEETYRISWVNGTESFVEFSRALGKMKPQSLGINILRERQNLEACVQGFENQIKDTEEKQKALETQRKTLEELEEHVRKNNYFQNKCQVSVMKKVKAEKPVFFCNLCEVSCPHPHVLSFRNYWGRTCSSCECKYADHEEKKEVLVEKIEERIETNQDLKNEAENKRSRAKREISKLGRELKDAEAEMAKLIDGCFRSVLRLRDLALKFDSDSTRQSILRLMEMLKRNNEAERVKTLQMMLEKR